MVIEVEAMEGINEIADLLSSHANRDKVVGLIGYTLKLWGTTTKKNHILTASGKIAQARAVLRLFDDAAAIKAAYAYGLGRQDGKFWGTLGVASSTFSLLYLQAEKLVFLLDTGIVNLDKELDYKIRTAHKIFWCLMAFTGTVRSIKALHKSGQDLNKGDATPCAPARFTQSCLTTTKLVLDTVHAVSWLPPGWMWGGMDVRRVSAVATATGVLGLMIHYNAKRLVNSK